MKFTFKHGKQSKQHLLADVFAGTSTSNIVYVKSRKVKDFVNYTPNIDNDSFNAKVKKATKNLSQIPDTDKWIREMRGSI